MNSRRLSSLALTLSLSPVNLDFLFSLAPLSDCRVLALFNIFMPESDITPPDAQSEACCLQPVMEPCGLRGVAVAGLASLGLHRRHAETDNEYKGAPRLPEIIPYTTLPLLENSF